MRICWMDGNDWHKSKVWRTNKILLCGPPTGKRWGQSVPKMLCLLNCQSIDQICTLYKTFLQCVQLIQKYIEFAIWESQCIDHITVWIFLIEAFCQSYLLLVNSVEGWEAKGNSVETRSVKINFTIKSIWSTINLHLALFFPPLSCITVNLKSFASDNDASLS